MRLEEWLLDICQTEQPDQSVIAYHVGMFENLEGATIVYLVGSKNFDTHSNECINEIDFEPTNNYITINESGFKELDWDEALELVEHRLRTFSRTEKFKSSFLGQARALTVGYDDNAVLRII